MSALPPKADIRQHNCHVRFVPKADVVALASLSRSSSPSLFRSELLAPRSISTLLSVPHSGLRSEFRHIGAIELAFLGHPLMRLSGAFDLVLKVVAFGRQKSRNLIDAARTAGAEQP